MRNRIRIPLSLWGGPGSCYSSKWFKSATTGLQTLHAFLWASTAFQSSILNLPIPNFNSDADPDPGFDFYVDPDPLPEMIRILSVSQPQEQLLS